ncbi:hypothetical protein Nham_4214 (plasmid) [Nitrobacter hamburgensis X14]|uniref:Uncharacterized protein n=1 Tax=Nitrobacter hamburgensis (strain DSM 10229 / NCIMB 13809 / X14) TaxID=323097 RepID=Q1QG14_NITHX|nr:hypothetical protein Nham_4214 [Nitrobacter hamburgensis X14]
MNQKSYLREVPQLVSKALTANNKATYWRTPHSIVAAVITAPAQLFEDMDPRQRFASGFGHVRATNPSRASLRKPLNQSQII